MDDLKEVKISLNILGELSKQMPYTTSTIIEITANSLVSVVGGKNVKVKLVGDSYVITWTQIGGTEVVESIGMNAENEN